jgi:AcrR family transcriptional regulator
MCIEMKKTNSKKQQTTQSKERILKTAISLFARQGFAETGVRELANMADVNLSMINYFFGCKKGVLKTILDNFFSGYLSIAKETLPGSEDIHFRLEQFVTASVNYFDRERDALKITISELPHDDADIVEHKASWAKQMIEVVNRELCQPRGAAKTQPIPSTCLAPMLTSLMASRFLFGPLMEEVQADTSKNVDIKTYIDILVDMLNHGIIHSPGEREVCNLLKNT